MAKALLGGFTEQSAKFSGSLAVPFFVFRNCPAKVGPILHKAHADMRDEWFRAPQAADPAIRRLRSGEWDQVKPSSVADLATRMEDLVRPKVVGVLNGQVSLVGTIIPAGGHEALAQGEQMLESMGPLGFPLV